MFTRYLEGRHTIAVVPYLIGVGKPWPESQWWPFLKQKTAKNKENMQLESVFMSDIYYLALYRKSLLFPLLLCLPASLNEIIIINFQITMQ